VPAASVTVPDERPAARSSSVLDQVRELIAARTELPLRDIRPDSGLLDDLHLSSFAVSQIAVDASLRLGLARLSAPHEFARATVGQMALALEQLAEHGGPNTADDSALPAGVDSWVRPFDVTWVARPLRPRTSRRHGAWRLVGDSSDPLVASLARLTSDLPDDGIIVCLPAGPDARQLELLLTAAQTALTTTGPLRFVVVERGRGVSAFVRTLHLEAPRIAAAVVQAPLEHADAASWIISEAASVVGFVEAHYDARGVRYEPILAAADASGSSPSRESPGARLGPHDVVVVSGGGKGIAAECALALTRRFGVRLLLLGRAAPTDDAQLRENLERLDRAGACYRYVSADILDRERVAQACAHGAAELGPITGVLHGAGLNQPCSIASLTPAALRATVEVKTQGLAFLLAAVEPDKLRWLVAFGSVLARTGLPGEADYALANQWLSEEVCAFQRAYPACRCLSLEWSLWSGTGMGERLGGVESLVRQGVAPITTDDGTAALIEMLSRTPAQPATVISGRLAPLPTLALESTELPLGRFLERTLLFIRHIELVTETELSIERDAYLADHRIDGQCVLPAVFVLEALAQNAAALEETTRLPTFSHLTCEPIVVTPGGATRLRIASLKYPNGTIRLNIRCSTSSFAVEHARAECRFEASARRSPLGPALAPARAPAPEVEPARDLYSRLLFHGPRFQRLERYEALTARTCVAKVRVELGAQWFSSLLPDTLTLGDPGARDAVIHCLQACVPHLCVLPVAVERITIVALARDSVTVVARERASSERSFVYDLEVLDGSGGCLERWEGLRLAVAEGVMRNTLVPAALGGPVVERCLKLTPFYFKVAPTAAAPSAAQPELEDIRAWLGVATLGALSRRPDGRPELAGPARIGISRAHAGGYTLAVAARSIVGCDVERLDPEHAPAWALVLGDRFHLAKHLNEKSGEPIGSAGARVWALIEAVKKAGLPNDAPTAIIQVGSRGLVVFSVGVNRVATLVLAAPAGSQKLVVAVLSVKPAVTDTVMAFGSQHASHV
jgi:enediyne polyketide synthase